MDVDRIIKRLVKAENTYQSVVGSEEKRIKDKVEFDFFIQYQPSDGFTLVANEDARVAPLDLCLELINKLGTLTLEEHLKLCI